MMRRLLPVLLVTSLLAGCSGGGKDAKPVDDVPDLGLDATPTTGVIRGVVVDEAIRPIAGVDLQVVGGAVNRTTQSDDDGFFGWDGLVPGTYFVSARKLGFAATQGSADVVAGDDEPPVLKLQMVADPASLPYSSLTKWEGFLQCGLSLIALCGVGTGLPFLGNVTQDRFSTVVPVEGIPLLIQSEAIWDTTTAASDQLWMWHSNADKQDGSFNGTRNAYAWVQGPSPLVMVSNATDIEESEFGTNNDIFLRMFTGSVEGTRNPTDPEGCYPGGLAPDVWCGGVGYSIQQAFEVYTTQFFGFLPQEGWEFNRDGPAAPPA